MVHTAYKKLHKQVNKIYNFFDLKSWQMTNGGKLKLKQKSKKKKIPLY